MCGSLKMKIKRKLAIFDLDGTLFDTKNVNYNAYCRALNECGFRTNLDYDFYCKYCNGNHYSIFLPKIISNIREDELEKIHKLKKFFYKEFLHLAIRNEHLFSFIESIKEDYYIALVTTASYENTRDILQKFHSLNYFELLITQEDVIKVKPAPEGFIKAMDKFDVLPENTIIFEDSDVGIEAAKLSGAKYIKVYGYN